MSEDVFRNTLVTLFTTVQKEFPEYDRQVKKCYINFNKSEPKEYITYTKEAFRPYLKAICRSDTSIFQQDTKVKLVRGLDFADIWAHFPQKFTILWSQLHRLYISVYNYAKENEISIDDEEESYANKYIEIVKLDYAIRDELKNLDNPNKSAELKEMMDKLKEVFEDNNSILTRTLKEVISEIIPNNLSNPEQFIQSLIGGEKVTEITAKLVESIKHKFESGQLKEEDIKHDLERIQNIFEKSGQNSVVKGVIENMKKEKETEKEKEKEKEKNEA
jgi:hypothetical protein